MKVRVVKEVLAQVVILKIQYALEFPGGVLIPDGWDPKRKFLT